MRSSIHNYYYFKLNLLNSFVFSYLRKPSKIEPNKLDAVKVDINSHKTPTTFLRLIKSILEIYS